MISPALCNPATVLKQFDFNKATLPAFIAMCMPDCPRPTTLTWLSERIGISNEDIIYKALRYLQNTLRIVFQVGHKRQGSRWWLANEVNKVALPFVRLLTPSDTRPYPYLLVEREPANTDHHLISDVEREPANTDHHLISDVEREPANTDHHLISDVSSQIIPHNVELSTPVVDDHLKLEIIDLLNDDQQQPIPQNAELFLRWIGMDEPIPTRFATVDPAWPLACWWYGRISQYINPKFHDPVGYVRRRLESGITTASPYPTLAQTWLQLDNGRRRTLLNAAQASGRRECRIHLPTDFGYFIPYREFWLIYNATNGIIAPPEWMPPIEPEDEPAPETAVSVPTWHITDPNAITCWKATLSEMELQMTQATFNTWLKDARLLAFTDNTYTIGVRNDYALAWLNNRLHDTILRTLTAIHGQPVSLKFVVSEQQ